MGHSAQDSLSLSSPTKENKKKKPFESVEVRNAQLDELLNELDFEEIESPMFSNKKQHLSNSPKQLLKFNVSAPYKSATVALSSFKVNKEPVEVNMSIDSDSMMNIDMSPLKGSMVGGNNTGGA